MPPIRVAFVISNNSSSPRGGARTRVGSVDSFHAPTWGSSAVYTPLQSGYTPLRGAEGISKAALTMVDRHRIAWNVIAYQRGHRMQFFAMTN